MGKLMMVFDSILPYVLSNRQLIRSIYLVADSRKTKRFLQRTSFFAEFCTITTYCIIKRCALFSHSLLSRQDVSTVTYFQRSSASLSRLRFIYIHLSGLQTDRYGKRKNSRCLEKEIHLQVYGAT